MWWSDISIKRREGKGREGKGKERKGREGREGKGRERKGRERKGREGKGKERKGREGGEISFQYLDVIISFPLTSPLPFYYLLLSAFLLIFIPLHSISLLSLFLFPTLLHTNTRMTTWHNSFLLCLIFIMLLYHGLVDDALARVGCGIKGNILVRGPPCFGGTCVHVDIDSDIQY